MEDLINELVSAAKNRMQTQAEFSVDLLPEIADEVIDEFSRDGLIDDDEDVETLKANLVSRLKNINENSN
ncbi:MAG: hypothetical protein HY452_02200 [Parcubacteria group bacterium]|uniref:Uncharacterized protein n=1 Tax=Candidatus Sungiibacteriota bacterium TaxID=2750080 RepID=A0A9D6HU54_9BACT|nr:hypothetical protein [Candidatus Sungbacteria bacterium]MBI4119051.1 hypothetical protein [Parcubacteria group bacterium]